MCHHHFSYFIIHVKYLLMRSHGESFGIKSVSIGYCFRLRNSVCLHYVYDRAQWLHEFNTREFLAVGVSCCYSTTIGALHCNLYASSNGLNGNNHNLLLERAFRVLRLLSVRRHRCRCLDDWSERKSFCVEIADVCADNCFKRSLSHIQLKPSPRSWFAYIYVNW